MSCRTSLYSRGHVDHIWGGPERYIIEAQKLVFSVIFFILIFLIKNFRFTLNLKFRSPNFHFLRPYIKIFNIALSINFWMLIFHDSFYTHSCLAILAVTVEQKISWIWLVNSFILKNSDFSDLGIFRPLAPLARFVWVCVCVNFALLRKHLVRFFSNLFFYA